VVRACGERVQQVHGGVRAGVLAEQDGLGSPASTVNASARDASSHAGLRHDPAMSGPLEGVRILDLTRLLPGAFATALLGDLGAEVLKVEQPGIGDPMRAYQPRIGDSSAFTWIVDRNKRSIALNLRDVRGVEVVRRLARDVDAVIEGFRPGVADRLGIGYDALRAANPALVYCSISGYGADGPLVREAGHDVNYVGRAGVLGSTGIAGEPAIPGVQVGDLGGGSLLAVAGLLAALLRAQRTGEGDHVDISMTDGAFALMAMPLGAHFAEGGVPRAGTELLTGGVPCYAIYTCADGRWITVGALEAPFWEELCAAVERPDLVATQYDPSAFPVWHELFASRPRDAWLALFAGRDACVGPVNDLAEAVADPQLAHRGMVVELEHPELGPVRQVGTPIKLREHPGGIRAPAPALGEATRELLARAGYDADEIEHMLHEGVAAAHPATGAGDPR
jgi:crotonobetainyl-CoA:carnitine CoA-transferase CaiB-like acyl-CoA transferase